MTIQSTVPTVAKGAALRRSIQAILQQCVEVGIKRQCRRYQRAGIDEDVNEKETGRRGALSNAAGSTGYGCRAHRRPLRFTASSWRSEFHRRGFADGGAFVAESKKVFGANPNAEAKARRGKR